MMTFSRLKHPRNFIKDENIINIITLKTKVSKVLKKCMGCLENVEIMWHQLNQNFY